MVFFYFHVNKNLICTICQIVRAGKPSLEREQPWVSSDGPVCATGLQEQLYVLRNFIPKHFLLGRNFMPKHFPHIQKTIYHEGIYPLGYDAAHLQHSSTADGSSFSLGANNPLSITRVPISMSPHLPCPSPPLPLRMTVIKSFIHQSCLRYSNWSITRAEGCSVREAVLLRVGLSVPHYRTWMSVHQPHALT